MTNLLEFDYKSKIIKVISGGQTGADQAGLEAARLIGIETGGMAPKGYRTEIGSDYSLSELYNLTEHSSANYQPRTKINVQNSTFTLILGNKNSPGCRLTESYCTALEKPYLCCDDMDNDELGVAAAKLNGLQDRIILNVAGNRESTNKGIYDRALQFVGALILMINDY
jgi:hypothetical protein